MKTEQLKVTGMTCDGCTSKVAHAIKAVNGVHDVVVSLSGGVAAVRYDEQLTTVDKLKLAVKGAGYSADASGTAQTPSGKASCCG
jgi:copper chaperone